MASTFQVVCTPIGNLSDLTPRGKQALAEADVVLCEDTRKSAPLVAFAGGQGKLVSCHQHNELQRVDVVKERLDRGDKVCLITDAGAPAVSDPGGRLLEAVLDAGFAVEVLPGPSAITAVLMGAAMNTHPFSFVGFLPRRKSARERLLRAVAETGFALVAFEAPGRVPATLEDLHAVFGPRRVVVGRELTKHYETFHRGTLGGPLSPPLVEKGEFVIVVEAGEKERAVVDDPDEAARVLLEDDSLKPKARAKQLAELTGLSVGDAYALLERIRAEGAR